MAQLHELFLCAEKYERAGKECRWFPDFPSKTRKVRAFVVKTFVVITQKDFALSAACGVAREHTIKWNSAESINVHFGQREIEFYEDGTKKTAIVPTVQTEIVSDKEMKLREIYRGVRRQAIDSGKMTKDEFDQKAKLVGADNPERLGEFLRAATMAPDHRIKAAHLCFSLVNLCWDSPMKQAQMLAEVAAELFIEPPLLIAEWEAWMKKNRVNPANDPDQSKATRLVQDHLPKSSQ